MLIALLRLWALASAVDHSSPYLGRVDAVAHVLVAFDAGGTSHEDAVLLLAIAREETNFRPLVSRVRGKRFCGVTQAAAERSLARCDALVNPAEAYRTSAIELTRWRKVGRTLPRTLAGYGCGWSMSPTCGSHGGRKVPYPTRVLRRARRFGSAIRSDQPASVGCRSCRPSAAASLL